MEHTARRPVLAAAALATVGALAVTPMSIAPSEVHTLSLSPARISTQAVQLTDAWFDLLNDTLVSTVLLGTMFVGANSIYPLPNPNFIAPVATQLVINPLTYTVQLFTGQGAQVPTEIVTHINNLANVGEAIVKDVPPAVVKQIQTPFQAAQLAIESITTATNKLVALLEAPAVFLNAALNSQFGLIGYNGPIALGIIVRNVLAQALFTAPPAALPFKKASSAAAITPKAAAAVVAPKSTATGSARPKPKPSSTATGSRKASAAKTGSGSASQGHSKRG